MRAPAPRTGDVTSPILAVNGGERLAAGLLTSGGLARLLDVDLKTVHSWVRAGHLTALKTGGGHLRFHRGEVVRFLRRHGFEVLPRSDGMRGRLALLGTRLVNWQGRERPTRSDGFERLFDALLALADGAYDTAVMDLDELGLDRTVELVHALRRGTTTGSLLLVGVSQTPALRSAFTGSGGDAAVAELVELGRLLRFCGAE